MQHGVLRPKSPFSLQSGQKLEKTEIAYSIYGDRDNPRKILFFHALSASSKLHEWWTHFQLDELAARYALICFNCLSSCHGTTGPESINPSTSQRYGIEFPTVSISDMVDLTMIGLQELGISRLDHVFGASLGGMQALDMYLRYPGFAAHFISACGTPLPLWTRYYNLLQVRMLREATDAGLEREKINQRLSYARALMRLSCTTEEALIGLNEKKVSASPSDNPAFQYLLSDSLKYPTRFSADSHIRIMDAMANFNLPAAHVSTASSRLSLIGIQGDDFAPARDVEHFCQVLSAQGHTVKYDLFETEYGHESWIIDGKRFYEFISPTLLADPQEST